MAERLSVKEMMAAARKAGAAKPAGESAPAEAAPEEPAETEAAAAPAAAPAAKAAVPTPESLGRPLTLKEKLAAARTGGAVAAGGAPAAPAAPAKSAAAAEPASEEAAAPAAPKAPVPTAADLGRPLTLKEKLAAARGGGTPAAAAPGAKPAAAAKAGAPAAAAKPAAARELPPLDKITDPRDLAEALRRAGVEKEIEAKAADAAAKAAASGVSPAAAAAAAKAAAAKKLETKAIPPKPSKDAATAASTAASTSAEGVSAPIARRPFLGGMGWIIAGWAAFGAGMTGWALGSLRFMFPNVLAEPPSTIKVGLATNFEKEQVNDRWKAEWGFWIVRSSAYDGEDKIYAIQSVCTHLGCPPNWLAAETKFKCPCHGSGFYISGVNFEGPAPRPLERFKVSQNDAGEIVVDKSQKFQEELKQWGDPDSFIVA